ncbi:ATP-binding protein [Palleronia sp. LCG004]|uniref:ATP-binding protein n=1 Tax=Palleronia sp. LCG004 TaxID=3079304 RepID=UPI0029431B21|nr:ATP-binding protein [Palleronia sp. LCG004]WOI55618.1 ATP-binding protein [Palleronia sp. LCG004]
MRHVVRTMDGEVRIGGTTEGVLRSVARAWHGFGSLLGAIFATSNDATARRQLATNYSERLTAHLAGLGFLLVAVLCGVRGWGLLPFALFFVATLGINVFEERYLAVRSRAHLVGSIALTLGQSTCVALANWAFVAQAGGFGLIVAVIVTGLWIQTASNVRTEDMRYFLAMVAPIFPGLGLAVGYSHVEFVDPSMIHLMLPVLLLGFLTSLRSGYVAHKAKVELTAARDSARDAIQSKDRFFAMISHEIRTPLNGVMGAGQMMEIEARTDREHERAAMILSSGTAMRSLLDDLLDHAKLEAGQFVIRPAPMAIAPLLKVVATLFADVAQAHGTSMRIEVSPDVPSHLVGDEVRIRQIVSNLVSNAVKHTEGGTVTLAATCFDGAGGPILRITVRDTGHGIPVDALERVFEPYRQLDDAVSASGAGTGLGLAIARELARLMGGDLSAASVPGQGASFTLTLPLVLPEEDAIPQARPLKAEIPAERSLRVLVVDDARLNRAIARTFLELAGMVVLEASQGAEALELLREEGADIVLTDQHMSVMGGVELLSEIRSDNALRDLPVILLSAADVPVECAFDGYLAKPINRADLYATIEAAMKRPVRIAA